MISLSEQWQSNIALIENESANSVKDAILVKLYC